MPSFLVEGNLVFWLGAEDIEAPPGAYLYIPPSTRHAIRCNSPLGVFTTPSHPGGFEISSPVRYPGASH
jgi:quercetin dioxygenase-like cupin family protein